MLFQCRSLHCACGLIGNEMEIYLQHQSTQSDTAIQLLRPLISNKSSITNTYTYILSNFIIVFSSLFLCIFHSPFNMSSFMVIDVAARWPHHFVCWT